MSFRAQYHGECADCGGELKDTDARHNADDEIVHVKCPPEDSREDVCSKCFQIHVGECP